MLSNQVNESIHNKAVLVAWCLNSLLTHLMLFYPLICLLSVTWSHSVHSSSDRKLMIDVHRTLYRSWDRTRFSRKWLPWVLTDDAFFFLLTLVQKVAFVRPNATSLNMHGSLRLLSHLQFFRKRQSTFHMQYHRKWLLFTFKKKKTVTESDGKHFVLPSG